MSRLKQGYKMCKIDKYAIMNRYKNAYRPIHFARSAKIAEMLLLKKCNIETEAGVMNL